MHLQVLVKVRSLRWIDEVRVVVMRLDEVVEAEVVERRGDEGRVGSPGEERQGVQMP